MSRTVEIAAPRDAASQSKNFMRAAWAMLGYTLLVILWGAFVRATGSGAGCGAHWPLCNGDLIPRAESVETLIEFSHRTTSGLALLGAVGIAVWAWRLFAPGHRVRVAANVALFFMLTEAAVGAGLVLFEYVAGDASIGRAYWMAAHLVNTFLLLAAQTLTAWWASGTAGPTLRGQQPVTGALVVALVAMIVLGASGAVTALGDTLMLTAGVTPDVSPFVAQLKALRVYHPLLAILVGALVVGVAWYVRAARPGRVVEQLAWAITTVYVGQLLVGALNVRLMAPVWLQLVHLLLADAIWIGVVLLAAAALAHSPQSAPLWRVKPQQT